MTVYCFFQLLNEEVLLGQMLGSPQSDNHGQTSANMTKPGRVFNFRSGRVHAIIFFCCGVKLPNLMLKIRPKWKNDLPLTFKSKCFQVSPVRLTARQEKVPESVFLKVNVIKLFYAPLTNRSNKLECLYLKILSGWSNI